METKQQTDNEPQPVTENQSTEESKTDVQLVIHDAETQPSD